MRRTFPKPRLAAATLAGVLAVLLGGYVFVIRPQRREAASLSAQIASAQAQLEAAQAPPSSNPDLAPIRVADLFRLSRAMPDKPDVPDVLLEISQIANETGITFNSITPGDPVVVGDYQKIPIALVFQGHFYDLSDFLYRLRNLVGVHDGELDAIGRLFSVDSVTFSEGDAAFPQVQANLQVDAYVFGNGLTTPVSGAPATPAPTAATSAAAPPSSTQAAPAATGPLPIPSSPVGSGTALGGGR